MAVYKLEAFEINHIHSLDPVAFRGKSGRREIKGDLTND